MFRLAWRHFPAPRVAAAPVALPAWRSIATTWPRRAAGSLFGEITESTAPETPAGENVDADALTPQHDTELQSYWREQAEGAQTTADKYVSPLKQRLFALNVAQHGFFKNNHIVRDDSGKAYKVSLTRDEIDMLEPTVYVQLYRLKLSMKKATVVNRFVRGCSVKTAINQLHFNPKKMATEVEKLLKRGLEHARAAGMDEDELYIQALWTGLDGKWVKRADIKGRGRTGKIEHPYIHVKCVLKGGQTRRRLAWEREQARRAAAPRLYLNNEPVNFAVRGLYKW